MVNCCRSFAIMDAQKALVSCSVITLTTIAFVWWYRKSKKEQIPTQWKDVGKVSELYMYPLKSGHRMEVTEMECTNYGPIQITDKTVYKLRDRFLIVYNDAIMEFKTGRAHPNMVLIEVSNHDTDHVALDAPDMRTLYVKIPEVLKENARLCKLHAREYTEIVDCGDEAASWLSRYILQKDSGLRLGFHDQILKDRTVADRFSKFYPNIKNDDLGIFSDLTSFMLINKTSVEELNSRLENDVSCCHFRGNIIVDNVDKPYVEDNWQWIKIGETIFRNVKPCTRCFFTTIDENGVRDKTKEPLATLKKYRQLADEKVRKAENNSPVMGIHLGVRKTGIIRLDDIVYVAEN